MRLDLYARQVLRDLGLSLVGSFLTAWALTAGGAAPESVSAALWAIRAQPPPGPLRGPHQTCRLSPDHVRFFPPSPNLALAVSPVPSLPVMVGELGDPLILLQRRAFVLRRGLQVV